MTTDRKSVPVSALSEGGRQRFQEELDSIQQDLVTMGSLVLENVQLAGDAMVEGRLDLVERVREADDRIDQLYLVAEKRTFGTLARQQPVAGDLRFLVAATRILYELERSGDLAYNCMKMLERLNGFPYHAAITPLLEASIAASCKVFAMGIDALDEMQPDAGASIDRADDEMDDLVSELYSAVGRHSDEIGLQPAIGLSRVGRFLERIADHAVNIGEHVTYVVTAELPGEANTAEGSA
ncbi:MAG: phosphate signaling complex protein PhoU, partial [Acidimicrobiia bacterium]|nr:phosphate signaling complex protein PhoU [Acidimicrobiia bacterium]